MGRHRPVIVALIVLVLASAAGQAQADSEAAEVRLIGFAGRLRLSLSLASFAVYAPSLNDLRLHAQQLVNLLEGVGGPHYVRLPDADEPSRGLRPDVASLVGWFRDGSLRPEARVRIAAAARNVSFYLGMALEAVLAGLRERRLDRASEDLLRAYAYLSAAYEQPNEIATVPGLRTILRLVGLAEAEG